MTSLTHEDSDLVHIKMFLKKVTVAYEFEIIEFYLLVRSEK